MKRLTRSRKEKVIAGVSGGLAEYLGVDPVLVRLGLIFLFLATGLFPILLAYFVAIIIVPKEPLQDEPQIVPNDPA